MNKHPMFIKVIVVFLFCTAFISADDTIIKGKDDRKVTPLLSSKPASLKSVNADSLLVKAQQDVLNYNKSVELKNRISNEVLEQNKKLLEYEKKENQLVKDIIIQLKKKSNEIKEVDLGIDSVCTKYKHPLFKKKYCIEYSAIYTLNKNGKTIKLQEIK